MSDKFEELLPYLLKNQEFFCTYFPLALALAGQNKSALQ